jgi:hypothetical protein
MPRQRDFLRQQIRRLLGQSGDDAETARIRDCGGQFRKADVMHAALHNRMLDAEQFSDGCFHGKPR